jgi:hypothetical protein
MNSKKIDLISIILVMIGLFIGFFSIFLFFGSIDITFILVIPVIVFMTIALRWILKKRWVGLFVSILISFFSIAAMVYSLLMPSEDSDLFGGGILFALGFIFFMISFVLFWLMQLIETYYFEKKPVPRILAGETVEWLMIFIFMILIVISYLNWAKDFDNINHFAIAGFNLILTFIMGIIAYLIRWIFKQKITIQTVAGFMFSLSMIAKLIFSEAQLIDWPVWSSMILLIVILTYKKITTAKNKVSDHFRLS